MTTLRLLRVSVLAVLACSAAAAVDQYLPTATFCEAGSGCEAVRRGEFGQVLGALLPAVSLLAYGFVYWASMRPGRLRKSALVLALCGGLGGLMLLLFQWLSVGAFCQLCVVTDGLSMLAAVMAMLALRKTAQGTASPTTWPLPAWGALYAFVMLAPPAYALSRPTPVPDYIRAYHVPNKINVVEVSDFQCPHCRRLHAPLAQALAPLGDEVHFVRLPYPLPGHRHARSAALLYLCAKGMGRGETAADALFAGDLATLDAEGLAHAIGLPAEALGTCAEQPDTAAQLDATMAEVAAGGFSGLPTVYIGGQTLLGFDAARGKAPYEEALARVATGSTPTYTPWPWLALGAVMLMLVSASARTVRRQRAA